MHKNEPTDLSSSVASNPASSVQLIERDSETVDESFSSDLLNAGGRVVKGKLRKIDPTKVRRSRIANRSIDEEPPSHFIRLAELMRQAGTNTVPALVHELATTEAEADHLYELVYGHRRHQVCLSESLPFTAIVVPHLDDVERAFLMAHENEGRLAPCPMDIAAWLHQLSNEGNFKNQATLAQATNIKPASVTNLLKLARLPAEVIAAFSSRSDIGHRHALPLEKAWKVDPVGIVERAKEITSLSLITGTKISKQRVFAMLTGKISIGLDASRSEHSESALNRGIVEVDQIAHQNSNEFDVFRNRDSKDGTLDPLPRDPVLSSEARFIQRFNKELPLVTKGGVDAGKVLASPTENTLIQLRLSLDDRELDWLATNLGDFLSGAPFLQRAERNGGQS